MAFMASKSPHFSQIILDETNADGQIHISKKFTHRYGKGLSDMVLLTVPSGAVWRVELKRRDGLVFLQKGWQAFADFYSLAHGHLLHFEYVGGSNFNIFIMDKSTTEIDYPLCSTEINYSLSSTQGKEVPAGDDEEEYKEPDIRESTRGKVPLVRSSNQKKKTVVETKKSSKLQKMHLSEGAQCSRKELEDPKKRNAKPYFSRGRVRDEIGKSVLKKTSKRKFARVMECEGELTIGYPFFRITMQSSNTKSCMALPKDFVVKHVKGENQAMTLHVEDRSWQVKFLLYLESSVCRFSAGWPAFVRENSLREGHVCTFEMIKPNAFRVSIRRNRC